MCFRSPSPPPLPEPEPVDSAIEPTATKVKIGGSIGGSQTTTEAKKKMKKTPNKVTGGKLTKAIAPKRLGTASLQIPLLTGSTNTSNLNY